MARVFVESTFPAAADRVWELVLTSNLLVYVARPLVRIVPVKGEAFPARWEQGTTLRCRTFLWGVIPLGTRTLFFERIDPAARIVQTRESDSLVRKWDHCFRVEPLDAGTCRYSDEVEVDAGWLTPVVAAFARQFYRHRHRRWKALLVCPGDPERLLA